ncbi:hypothetical protein BASA81_004075 [Batrachochytrium salamandrivorans]|nr:hypothetical protein BASA81_004075 [Batrachochytrium salamandrivorans]
MEQEAQVFVWLFVVFAWLGVGYLASRFVTQIEPVFPLLLVLAFAIVEGLYQEWIHSSTVYLNRSLEYAFFRMALITTVARFWQSHIVKPEYQAPDDGISTKSSYFVLVLVGIIWGVEDCLPHDLPSEPFLSLLLTWLVWGCKYRRRNLGCSFVSVLILAASVLMAKSGKVTGLDALAGTLLAIRFMLLDFVIRRGDLKLIWLPGSVASVIILVAFGLFQSTPVGLEGKTRGVLDCLGAAGLGALFALGWLMAAFTVMRSYSIVTLMATSCLAEVLTRCVLSPLAGLPISFPVILPLNITGFVLTLLAFVWVVRSDPFASSLQLAKLFKFLDEEGEEEGDVENGIVIEDEVQG